MKIRVAISQRIIPHYRVPVFQELSTRPDLDITVFYGNGFRTGSQVNSDKISGFNARKLFTVFLNYKGIYGSRQLRVWHPGLFFHLIKGNYDVIIVEPSTNFYNDLFIFLYCKIFRKKFIWYESGSVPKEKRPRFRRMIDPILSLLIKGADAYITYTSYADESLIRDFMIDRSMIFRAQNTIDTSKIESEIAKYLPDVEIAKEKYGLTGFKVNLYIGGIENRKRIINLIRASTRLNDIGIPLKTLIVGDGPDKDDLISKMTPKEREYTVFAGKHIEDSTLFIVMSHAVILPSAGGLSVIQALACGKPFIGSEKIEHGGIKDYVINGFNGYLVKENDVNDLFRALKELYSDEKKYEELCENAKTMSTKFTIEKMVDGIENAIKYTINRN